MQQEPIGRARYRSLGPLGQGAMGSVDLVVDEMLGRRVARKRIRRTEALDRIRFKLEFRAIEKLVHPNLVRLYELGEDDEGLYFTMEAVEGVDLTAFRRSVRLDVIPRIVAQIVDALAFLHSRGVVHRDLKPSNVLVTPDVIVKLVDFGVLAKLDGTATATERVIAGTPGYMAPEQIRGDRATPASDLYAVGCVLFELLSGRPVFSGTLADVLAAHLEDEPQRLSEVVPDVHPAVDAACSALLQKTPEMRPSASDLHRSLLEPWGVPAETARISTSVPNDLVGRVRLQARLLDWANGRDETRLLLLHGPTGAGKTALADWLAQQLCASGRTVLRGRSRPSERVAFNAWDAAVDDLACFLALAGATDAETQAAAKMASTAFPVLGHLESHRAERVREEVREKLFGLRRAPEDGSRRMVFEALGVLLDAVAKQAPGALLILDDLQWADGDSIGLLDHYVERGRSSLPILLILRDDVDAGVGGTWVEKRPEMERLYVDRLSEDDLAEIVLRSARAAGGALGREGARDAARTADGRPFLAEVLGRALATGSLPSGNARSALFGLIGAASKSERSVLSLVTAADDWVDIPTLVSASGLPLARVVDAVDELQRRGLLRRGSGEAVTTTVHVFHDGVRASTIESLTESERAGAHSALADFLLSAGPSPEERVVRHLLAANRIREAAAHARTAARAAETLRAFDLAADMYAVALRDDCDDRDELTEARAVALERAGRYDDAAACWRSAALTATGERRVDLLFHEAHALVAANRTAAGLERLDETLVAAGLENTRTFGWRAAAGLARFAVGPLPSLSPRSAKGELRRAERHVKMGILLCFLDPPAGIGFLQGARRELLGLGADHLVAGCDYMFCILALIGSRRVDRVPLADRYRMAADSRVRGRTVPPEVRGMPPFIDGLQAFRRGRWDEARRYLHQAAEISAESNGTTERMMALSWGQMPDAYEQNLPKMKENHEWFTRHASDCGGTFIAAHVELVGGYIQQLEGRFEQSRATITGLADMFDEARPNIQRAGALIYRHMADVYLGDPAGGRRQFADAVRRARRFALFHSTYAGPFAQIGALLEANALRCGDPQASLRRVEHYARIIDDAPPLVAGVSFRARAYTADARGQPELALRHLLEAEQEALRFGRRIDVEIARYQRGKRLGGDEGAALCAGARRSIEALGAGVAVLEEDAGLR